MKCVCCLWFENVKILEWYLRLLMYVVNEGIKFDWWVKLRESILLLGNFFF